MTAFRKALLVVEGQHDEAFVAKILTARHGFKVQRDAAALDPYWRPTVPEKFPYKDDLRRRVPVPMFYESAAISLAVLPAGGDTNLVDAAMDTIALLSAPPSTLGFVLDADHKNTPLERFTALRTGLAVHTVVPGEHAGEVAGTSLRCGIYVLPDNHACGTLEVLLLQCADRSYASALRSARTLVEGVASADYADDDLKDFDKPAGRDKATIAAITAVLKPGKTLQTSLSDDRWITSDTLDLPAMKAVEDFLIALLTVDETAANGVDDSSR